MQVWSDFLNQLGYAPNSLPAGFYDTSLKTDSSYEASGVGAEKLFAFSQISVGSGDAIGVMSGSDPMYRLWIGDPDPSLAEFSVDKFGHLVATGASISGDIDLGGTGNTDGILRVFNASSTEIIQMDNLGIQVASGQNFTIVSAINATLLGLFGYDGAETILASSGGKDLALSGDGASAIVVNADGSIYIVPTSGNQTVFFEDSTFQGFNLNDVAQIEFFDARLVSGRTRYAYKDTSGVEQFSITPAGGGNTKISMNGFDLRLTSTKTAIVPTSQGFNAVYAVEAPEVWFFDFAPDKDHIDPLFLEVTEGEMKTLKTEEGEILVFRRRAGHADKRFTPKTAEQFEKNEKFLRMSK